MQERPDGLYTATLGAAECQRVGRIRELKEGATLLQREMCGVHSVEGTNARVSAEAEIRVSCAEAIGKLRTAEHQRGQRASATRTRRRREETST